MDLGDTTDPNLDDDFQTLLEVRQKRTNAEQNVAVLRQLINDTDPSSCDIQELLLEVSAGAAAAATSTTANGLKNNSVEAEKLRSAIFDAAMRDDATHLQKLMKRVETLGFALSDSELRSLDDNSTVLHYVLEKELWDVARYLIGSCSERLLIEGYNVTVREVSSQKSCLHILTEKGNYDLAKQLLDRLTTESVRKDLLRRTVLVELEGQRPRQLSSMHIAALKGHTRLIELFHNLGVDINITNNKNDTPVLWATRGNHIETVRYLIGHGADLHLENDKGSTPLYWAVRYGYTKLVEILAREGKANVRQERKLGLVAPIVLASALGYHEIVRVLLENGADANVKIRHDQTALHVAAAEGTNQVIEVLLDRGKVDINHADCNGNTAILFAAKAGDISTMKLLADRGANLDCKNKMGQNIWDFAMLRPEKYFLKAVAQLYRRAKLFRSDYRKPLFVIGKTLLHVAASSGDVDKMRCLLEIGADPKGRDLNGNTYFHVAARDDRVDVVQAFLAEVEVDSPNNGGDTALHLSCKKGHLRTTQMLLQKAKLDARNKLGMTPLHEAVASDAVSAELIRVIVDMIVKASNWSLVDATDSHGNTALHIAARLGLSEILVELSSLNPKIANDDGDTPFHVAASSGIPFNLDTIIDVFNKPEKGVNLDQTNNVGDSCLHISARRGDLHGVNLLVSCGADLSLQNHDGNTVVHVIIEESVEEPTKKEALLEVFRGIKHTVVRWWCMKNDHQFPNEESEMYYALLRIAMVHLTSKVYNGKDLNALSYAIKMGAADLLEEILNMANVYRFRERTAYVYDITSLIPQTTVVSWKLFPRKKSRVVVDANFGSLQLSIKDCGRWTNSADNDINQTDLPSCLDLVVSLEDEVLASKILDILPFKQLVRNYWNAYQWIYSVLMVVHVVYMSLFSFFVIPARVDLHPMYNSSDNKTFNSSSDCNDLLRIYNSSVSANLSRTYNSSATLSFKSVGSYRLYGLFLIWPLLLLLYEIYSFFSKLNRSACCCYFNKLDGRKKDTQNFDSCTSITQLSVLSLPFLMISTLFRYLGHLIAVAFCALVIAWYAIYLCASDISTYVEIVSMVMLFGWLFTISFTKGFEDMHVYSIMLKNIVIRDITRYLIMYIFVLLGCGLAFNVLFQFFPFTYANNSSIWNTLFNVFNLMLGLGSLFDDDFDDNYKTYGGNPVFVKWLYIFYIICATIILMSLLVAMMTDTYTDIKAKEGTTWKVGSLRLALQIERSMPCIKQLLRATRIVRDRISFDAQADRWFMAVSIGEIGQAKVLETDELLKTVQRLENKMDHIQLAYTELARQIESLRTTAPVVAATGSSNAPLASIRRSTRVFSVVKHIRERPFTLYQGKEKY